MKPPSTGRSGVIAVVVVMAILVAFVAWERHRFVLTVRNDTGGETVRDIQLAFGREVVTIESLAPGETATLTDLRLVGESTMRVLYMVGKERCLHERESVVREHGHRIDVEIRSCFVARSRAGAWPSVFTSGWTKTPNAS